MNSSNSVAKIAPALVKAWPNILGASKSGTNPHFKSSYSTLEEVIDAAKGALLAVGVVALQPVNGEFVDTILLHESGEWIGGSTKIMCSKPNDPQAMGSAITYAKRYGLQAICLIPSVDDDGEAAMGRDAKPSTKDPNSELQMEAGKQRQAW